MPWEKWRDVFLEEAKKQLESAPSVSPVHKTDHLLRVWKKAKVLSEKLNGDLETMAAAVFLHDLGRHHGLEIHGEKSAELAKPILEKHGFPKEKIPKVLEAIAQHDYTFPQEKRTLLESKILYDCDKLDVFGVIGVYRTILFLNAGRTTIDKSLEQVRQRFEGLSFPESREIAEKDYNYKVEFLKELKKELNDGE